MATITIQGCDGCHKPASTRKPVHTVAVTQTSGVIDGKENITEKTYDVHDLHCLHRATLRDAQAQKAERAKNADTVKTAKAAPTKK